MRLLKTSGGLARGRGITDGTVTKWAFVALKCVPICNALENFCGVHSSTSDKHTDLRPSRTARDSQDCHTFINWLSTHSLFSYKGYEPLVCISTGEIANTAAIAGKSYTVGKAGAEAMTGYSYAYQKMKRKDRVLSISKFL